MNVDHLIGTELGVSDWVTITQQMIDTHADTTGDAHWIHNDPERAAGQAPFGGPIAQGFLLLSHCSKFQEAVAPLADNILYALNYGFDRVRFLSPVPVNARIRGRLELSSVRKKDDTRYVVTTKVSIEVEGSDKPAVVADWLGLVQLQA
jgi:acyl dehydratase